MVGPAHIGGLTEDSGINLKRTKIYRPYETPY